MSMSWKHWIACLACLGMISPMAAFGETPSSETRAVTQVRDVALGTGNTLVGQVVDQQGHGVANATVRIANHTGTVAETSTDQAGYFRAAGLPGGVFQISAAGTNSLYRVWANQTAPPSAAEGVLLVQRDDQITRAQCPDGSCGPGAYPVDPNACGPGGYYEGVPGHGAGHGLLGLLANPWVVAGAVAVAIAVPLALDDDNAS